MSDNFQTSKSFIEQAKNYIGDFEIEYSGFIKSDPIGLIGEIDSETSEQVHKVKLIKQMPENLSEIAFEAVSLLRSALDEAVSGIPGESNNKTAVFPFSDSESEFEKALQEEYKYLPLGIAEILRSFKPYKGGNNLLWALNEVHHTGKHSLVCPIAVMRGGSIQSGETFSKDSYLPNPVWDRTKNEMEIFRQPQGVETEGDFDISYFIAMRDIEFIDGEPADVILNDFLSTVENIIKALESEE